MSVDSIGAATKFDLVATSNQSGVVAASKSMQPATKAWRHRYIRWLWISDVFVTAIVVSIAHVLRFGEINGPLLAGYSRVNYIIVSAVLLVLWVSALTIYRTRTPRLLGNGLEESRLVLTATFTMFGIVAVISLLFRLDIARGYLAIAWPLGMVSLLTSRWLIRRYVSMRRRHGKFVTTVLAVGAPSSVRGLANSFARHPSGGMRLVGTCGPRMPDCSSLEVSPTVAIPIVRGCENISEAVIQSGADTVVLTSGELSPDDIHDLSWELEKLDVDLIVAPGVADVAAPRLSVWLVGGSPLIRVDKPQYSGAKRFKKRAFDICFSALMLVAVAPVMLAAALAIKITSRGPVFYLSERIGLDGVPFQMVKFRTMVVDADARLAEVAHLNECDGVLFKIRSDPRVTRVGRILRRFSIDELPQFFNAVRGQMSVVGPRPPLRREADAYDMTTRRRLLVRPGITGLWQISGRSDLSWDDSVRLDLSYVENWSMTSDLVIAMGTAKAVLSRSGAY